jgi:hypothetical protein
MTKEITYEHKQNLEEMKRRLSVIGFKEANFLKIELLFYEALEIARAYGSDVQENKLLSALKQLQAHEYQDTKNFFKKSSQREQVIRRFITGFKTVLSAGIKNLFFTPQPSTQ